MYNKKEINMENTIMNKVLSGEIKMKPKIYFLIGSVLTFIGSIGLIIGSVFFTNLTLFLIRKHGPGTGRLIQMLDSFPLWIPFIALILVIMGITLLKKYDFAYKRNYTALAFAILLAVVLSALIIDTSGLNEVWSRRGPMKRFYSRDIPTLEGNRNPKSPHFNRKY